MARLLSAAMVQSKNVIDGGHPFVWLFQLDIVGAPLPLRFANYDQDILYHGLLFSRFSVDVDSIEDANNMALVHLRVTAVNVDQQIQSLLENYWSPMADPQWTVTIWQVDVTQPDEVPFASGDVFTVLSCTTDLLVASFDLIAEGLTLTTSLPKRRYVTSSGFPLIPRRI
jgi:hypothetical protein